MKKTVRTIRRSGHSLVVGLTPATIEILELKEGDLVKQKVKGKTIIITKEEA